MPGFQVSERLIDTFSIDRTEILTPPSDTALEWPLAQLICRLGSPSDALTRVAPFMALTRYPALSHFAIAGWRGGDLCGLAYAGQRNAFGIPLGTVILGADDYGDQGVIAHENDRALLVARAILNLLRYPTVHTIIVRDQPAAVDLPQRRGLSSKDRVAGSQIDFAPG